jgi:hypothetical protein
MFSPDLYFKLNHRDRETPDSHFLQIYMKPKVCLRNLKPGTKKVKHILDKTQANNLALLSL